MAKKKVQRTYWDALGYKKKKRRRAAPQFSTLAEYDAWISSIKSEAGKAEKVRPIPDPVDPLKEALERMLKALED